MTLLGSGCAMYKHSAKIILPEIACEVGFSIPGNFSNFFRETRPGIKWLAQMAGKQLIRMLFSSLPE